MHNQGNPRVRNGAPGQIRNQQGNEQVEGLQIRYLPLACEPQNQKHEQIHEDGSEKQRQHMGIVFYQNPAFMRRDTASLRGFFIDDSARVCENE